MKAYKHIPKQKINLSHILEKAEGKKDLLTFDSDIPRMAYILDEKGVLVVSTNKGYLLLNEDELDTFVEELTYMKEEVIRWRRRA